MGIQILVGAVIVIVPIALLIIYKLREGHPVENILHFEVISVFFAGLSGTLVFLLTKILIKDSIVEFCGVVAYLECFYTGIIEFINKRKYSLDKIKPSYLFFYLLFPLFEIVILMIDVRTSGNDNLIGTVMTIGSILIGISGNLILIDFVILQNSKEYLSKKMRNLSDIEKKQRELESSATSETDVVKNYLSDYKNDICRLHGMLSGGNIREAKRILFEDFESFTNHGTEPLCENTYVNAIVSSKKTVCRNKGIRTDFSVEVPQNIGIDSIDICTVLGNVLDNAINGCLQSRIEEKYIDLFVGIKGEYLVIREINTADKYSQKTDQSRKHYGKKIIRDYAEHYSGSVKSEWNKKSDLYEVFIMMLQKEVQNDIH